MSNNNNKKIVLKDKQGDPVPYFSRKSTNNDMVKEIVHNVGKPPESILRYVKKETNKKSTRSKNPKVSQSLQVIQDQMDSGPAQEFQEAAKYIHGVHISELLTPEEMDFFSMRLGQYMHDHPEYNTTHDAMTACQLIVDEIRYKRAMEYEFVSYQQSKKTGMTVPPNMMFKETKSLVDEISRLGSDGQRTRHSRDSLTTNLRVTIASVAASINKERLEEVKNRYREEEEKFIEYVEKQQITLDGLDTSGGSVEDIKQIMLKLAPPDDLPKFPQESFSNATITENEKR